MKQFLHEALPPEQQLLILKGCCCTRPSGCAVKSSGAAAELRFLSHPIRPSDIIHSQMLAHHFFPTLLLFVSHFISLQAVCCTAQCKSVSARSLQGAGTQHPHPRDAPELVFALPPNSRAVCEAARWHLGKAAGLTAWETKGFYFSPSRQSTDTLPHAVPHQHAEMGIR